jgi:hypothetical protein
MFNPGVMIVLYIGGAIYGYFKLKKDPAVDRFGLILGSIIIYGIGTAILGSIILYTLINGIGWILEDIENSNF